MRNSGHAGELVVLDRLADGEEHHDRLGQQAAGDEGQRLRGGPVEPLRVVDQAHERLCLGRVGEQAQDRQGHQEAIGRTAHLQPERRAQRIALRERQPVGAVQQRRAQVMQAGEGELHLGLHARGPHHAAPRGLAGDVVDQRCLADPRLAAQHQDRAGARPGGPQQPVEAVAFTTAALQQRMRRAHPRNHSRAH